MKKCIFTALAAASVLFSCQKEENLSQKEPETATLNPTEYYPMTEGSYWIYENYEIDTNGTATATNSQDSVYIAGDTTLNGNGFIIMKTAGPSICFNRSLRDSSGYLVSPQHFIHFAPNDFKDSLNATSAMLSANDTLYNEVSWMEKVSSPITVPAGSFDVLMLRRDLEVAMETDYPKRELREYRARNVGTVIMQNSTVNNPTIVESRLVRYHIN